MTCLLQSYCTKGEGCDNHIGYDIERCSAFNRKPLTRFEYMQTCSMEELVDLLQDIMHVCRGCTADCALVCHHYKTKEVVLCCGDGIKDWLQEEYHADEKQ